MPFDTSQRTFGNQFSNALVAELLEIPELTEEIDDRISPLGAERGKEYPQIVYRRTYFAEIEHSLDGPCGLWEAKYEFAVVSTSYDEVLKVTNILVNHMECFRGDLGYTNDRGEEIEFDCTLFVTDATDQRDPMKYGFDEDLVWTELEVQAFIDQAL